jgi:integrase/recombinase XerD
MEADVSAFLASLTSEPAYSESTRLAYASDLRVFLGYLRQALARPPSLSDLNAGQVAGFLAAESLAGRRPNTLVRRRATLRRFLAFLRETGRVSTSLQAADASQVDSTLAALPAASPAQFLTDAEIARLWASIETSARPRARRDQAILMLLLETGLSVGTLVALDLSDVDLRSARLRLPDKNSRVHWLSLHQTTETLSRYLREGRPELHPAAGETALFVSQMGGRMSRQGIWQILHHWGQLAEPRVNLSPRLVRHTAALRMSRNGQPTSEIQALLGHRNFLSTQALLRRLRSADGDSHE